MSFLTINTGEMFLEIENSAGDSVTVPASMGVMEVKMFLDDSGGESPIDIPALEFTIATDPEDLRENFTFNFRILRLADIDALRRYCEMTIAHAENGYLT